MREQSHTPQQTAPHVASYRSALRCLVTIFRHLFHVPQTVARRSSTPRIDRNQVTPTRHWLLYAPHADEC